VGVMKKVNSDTAYEYIRKRILSGEYPPGHSLMTEQLSGDIGVSRTPVREALCKLEADGLVSIRARLGASVKKMDIKEMQEMCDLRLALEGHAAALCALNHSEIDLRDIRYALEAMRELTAKIIASDKEEPMLTDLVREDVRFHIAIMTAAKNSLIKKEILRLHLLNRVGTGPSIMSAVEAAKMSKADSDANRRAVLASHEQIFDAIARHDPAGAKAAMERHIQDIIDKNLRRFRAQSGQAAQELTPEDLVYSG
jgi:DNA-binding GntR family transcriptional regulator